MLHLVCHALSMQNNIWPLSWTFRNLKEGGGTIFLLDIELGWGLIVGFIIHYYAPDIMIKKMRLISPGVIHFHLIVLMSKGGR